MSAEGELSHSPGESSQHIPVLPACFDLCGNLCNQNDMTIFITVDRFRQV